MDRLNNARTARSPLTAKSASGNVFFLCAILTTPTLAGNGLIPIGFGFESSMMGGADVAVARDTTALITNPAGLSQIKRPALDIYSATSYNLDVGHRDPINDVRVSNHFGSVGGLGYSQPLGSSNVTLGFGAFVQGGTVNYDRLATGFGNNDELSGVFGVVNFTAGAAWQLTEKLAVGASVSALYSRVEQKMFPNTSVLGPTPLFGFQLKGVDGINPGFRMGAQYKPDARWTWGALFAAKSKLTMDGGSASVNLTAAGLGVVNYNSVRLSGLALPYTVAAGVAWQATERTLLSFKLEWLNWADALKSSTQTLSSPSQAGAPATIVSQSALDWKNQTVFAVGVAHQLDERTTLRAGFNYGANPLPAQTMTPLLAPIGEQHYTAGGSHRFDGGWELGGGLEYQPSNRVSYSNPQTPLGVNAQERNKYLTAHLMLSRRW